MARENRELKEKMKDDQKITNRHRNMRNESKIHDIPIRDVHGGHNSDEELKEEREEEKADEIICPQYDRTGLVMMMVMILKLMEMKVVIYLKAILLLDKGYQNRSIKTCILIDYIQLVPDSKCEDENSEIV